MAVTISDLKELYPSNLTDAQYTDALDTATVIVDEDMRPNCAMSNERYDKITLYLAAHFASITASSVDGSSTGGAVRRSKLGEADESYAVPADTEFGYNSTRWGQMAIALDSCGILSGIIANKGLKAQFRIVGKPCVPKKWGCC